MTCTVSVLYSDVLTVVYSGTVVYTGALTVVCFTVMYGASLTCALWASSVLVLKKLGDELDPHFLEVVRFLADEHDMQVILLIT